MLTPQNLNWWWLDRFLSKWCSWIFCSSCGYWRWDHPCHAKAHWQHKIWGSKWSG